MLDIEIQSFVFVSIASYDWSFDLFLFLSSFSIVSPVTDLVVFFFTNCAQGYATSDFFFKQKICEKPVVQRIQILRV